MKRLACLFGPSMIVLALAGAAPAKPLLAQESAGVVAPAPVAATIAAARKEVLARYVLPETAAKLDAALARAESQGAFSGLSGEALAVKINAVMRTVTADGHLSVSYDPATAAELAAHPDSNEEDPDLPESYKRDMIRSNGGVVRMEVLPGNLRYVDYRGFMWGTPEAEAAIANAAQFLRGGDAIVIDLRRNGGGSDAAVAALTSYFLPSGTRLMRFEERGKPDRISETGDTPFSLADRPVYVLTSRGSFSAAEEFAAHVSAFKFGTLVGETTGGGGFNNMFVPLPGGYVMSISFGRAVHTVTGKDWEQVGIAPAIAVPAADALIRAQAAATAALAAKANPAEREGYARLARYYDAVLARTEPGLPPGAYAGTYGSRTISVHGAGYLTTRRGDGDAVRLVALGTDLFAPETSPAQQFRFVREGGRVVALEIDVAGQPSQRAGRSG